MQRERPGRSASSWPARRADCTPCALSLAIAAVSRSHSVATPFAATPARRAEQPCCPLRSIGCAAAAVRELELSQPLPHAPLPFVATVTPTAVAASGPIPTRPGVVHFGLAGIPWWPRW